MRPLARKAVPILIAVAAALYAADFAQWSVRQSRGSGMGTIAVDQYLATTLKGNKAEYDFLGTVQQPCARALFPHASAAPCWWLARHTSQWQ
jgi:hypothetical protein